MINTDPTVFIVDDDPSVRKSLLRLVRSGGWHGEAFASPQDFLARPEFSGIGCLILDVRMPGMMGPELCSVMAEKNISLPVIFLTGSVDLPKGVEAWNKGVVDYLVKPVNAETLMNAVRQALEGHRAALARSAQQIEVTPTSPNTERATDFWPITGSRDMLISRNGSGDKSIIYFPLSKFNVVG